MPRVTIRTALSESETLCRGALLFTLKYRAQHKNGQVDAASRPGHFLRSVRRSNELLSCSEPCCRWSPRFWFQFQRTARPRGHKQPVLSHFSCEISRRHTLLSWTPTFVPGTAAVAAIAAGDDHSLTLGLRFQLYLTSTESLVRVNGSGVLIWLWEFWSTWTGPQF